MFKNKKVLSMLCGVVILTVTAVVGLLFTTHSLTHAHAAVSHPQSQDLTVYITSYGYDDNDDGNGHFGTAQIAYPIIHDQATEGSGTYDDPTTFATDQNEFAPGTRVYVPSLQKYFIMEDGCVECATDWQNGKYHIDLWMGPSHSSSAQALNDCEDKVTQNSASIVVNPPTNLTVDTTPMFANDQCTAQLH